MPIMRNEPNMRVEPYRLRSPASEHGANWGAFKIRALRIISSGTPKEGDPGWPWEHVSVSLENRCQTWDEMAQVKNEFWHEEETVVQFHPAREQYVNVHPHCLHLWRRLDVPTELPPRYLLA